MTKRLLASGEVVDADELEAAARVRPPPRAPVPRAARPCPRVASPLPAPRTDLELLEALAHRRAALGDHEWAAFGRMLDGMRRGAIRSLSYAQRAWAQEVAHRIGLDVDHPGDWREVAAELRRDPTCKPR